MATLQSILRKPAVKVDPSTPEWLCADPADENTFTIESAARIHKVSIDCGCSKSATHWIKSLPNLHPDVNIKGDYHFEHLVGGFDAMLNRDLNMSSSPAEKPVVIKTLHAAARPMLFAGSRDNPMPPGSAIAPRASFRTFSPASRSRTSAVTATTSWSTA